MEMWSPARRVEEEIAGAGGELTGTDGPEPAWADPMTGEGPALGWWPLSLLLGFLAGGGLLIWAVLP
jgi:hypothetical protein